MVTGSLARVGDREDNLFTATVAEACILHWQPRPTCWAPHDHSPSAFDDHRNLEVGQAHAPPPPLMVTLVAPPDPVQYQHDHQVLIL